MGPHLYKLIQDDYVQSFNKLSTLEQIYIINQIISAISCKKCKADFRKLGDKELSVISSSKKLPKEFEIISVSNTGLKEITFAIPYKSKKNYGL